MRVWAPRKKRPPFRRSPGSIPVVLELMVGVVGFEPTTPYTPCRCPAGLGHTPTHSNYNTHDPGAGESQRTAVSGQVSGYSLGAEQMTPQMMLVRLKE